MPKGPVCSCICLLSDYLHGLCTDLCVFFVIAPAQTLGIDTLLLMIIGSAIAFVAILIHRGFHGCNKPLFSFIFCIALNGSDGFCYHFGVHNNFYNGLKSAGMGGHILSLIPLLAVAVVGYIIKEKYFR